VQFGLPGKPTLPVGMGLAAVAGEQTLTRPTALKTTLAA